MRESSGRALRIAELKNIIEVASQTDKFIDEKKLLAELSLKWNVARRKAKEYLDLLLETQFCVRTDKGILTKQMAEAQMILERAQLKEEELKGGENP